MIYWPATIFGYYSILLIEAVKFGSPPPVAVS
jgi:hypothetical protein